MHSNLESIEQSEMHISTNLLHESPEMNVFANAHFGWLLGCNKNQDKYDMYRTFSFNENACEKCWGILARANQCDSMRMRFSLDVHISIYAFVLVYVYMRMYMIVFVEPLLKRN